MRAAELRVVSLETGRLCLPGSPQGIPGHRLTISDPVTGFSGQSAASQSPWRISCPVSPSGVNTGDALTVSGTPQPYLNHPHNSPWTMADNTPYQDMQRLIQLNQAIMFCVEDRAASVMPLKVPSAHIMQRLHVSLISSYEHGMVNCHDKSYMCKQIEAVFERQNPCLKSLDDTTYGNLADMSACERYREVV